MAHIPLPLFVTRLQAHGAWGKGWTLGEDFASIREGDIRCVAATPGASPESLSATVPVPVKSIIKCQSGSIWLVIDEAQPIIKCQSGSIWLEIDEAQPIIKCQSGRILVA